MRVCSFAKRPWVALLALVAAACGSEASAGGDAEGGAAGATSGETPGGRTGAAGSATAGSAGGGEEDAALPPGPPAGLEGGVEYLGTRYFLHGINAPWMVWACDIGVGCDPSGGVWNDKHRLSKAGPKQTLELELEKVHGAGLRVLRYWVIPGDPLGERGNPRFVADASGKPEAVHPAVFEDLDALVDVAEKTGIFLNLTLFSSHYGLDERWINDASYRQAIASVLGTLFERYRDQKHVMAWELFNEPEAGLGNPSDASNVYAQNVRALFEEVIAVQRQKAPQSLVNVGCSLNVLGFFAGLDADFFSPHFYDGVAGSYDNPFLTTPDDLRAQHGVEQPILLGELYLGSGDPPDTGWIDHAIDPLQRLNEVSERGYMGAWGWSYFWDATFDKLEVDLVAARSFADAHPGTGPQ